MQETTLFLQTTDGLAWCDFEFDLVGGLFLDGPDLDIIDREEADLAIELTDPPAAVELVLDADDVALFEGKFLVASGFEGVNRLALLHERRHPRCSSFSDGDVWCVLDCFLFLFGDRAFGFRVMWGVSLGLVSCVLLVSLVFVPLCVAV